MAILHVRNIPDELYAQIKEQAQQKKRSISAEVVILLEQAMTQTGPAQSEVLNNIRRRRFFNPTEAKAPDSTTLLHEDRAR